MKHRNFLLIFATSLLCVAASAVDYSNNVGMIKGHVTDVDGKPIAGVVMSDGFDAVQTDAEGYYCFAPNPASYYVFCSLPAEYEVPMRQGQPVIYKKIDDRAGSYNFILRPLKGGKESKFNIFFVGDPQCQNIYHADRLRTEAIPDVKAYSRKQKGHSYAITLGDIGYCEGGRNTNYLFPIIRNIYAEENTGMPVFQTVGNHDHDFALAALDQNNPTITIRRNRMYEAIFGPVNYSWNRGDVHFISMNDVNAKSLEHAGKYAIGTSKEQLEWIRKDLSFVPKDKMVVLTVHIPIAGKNAPNTQKIVEMMGEFADALVISGHTHTNIKRVHPNGVKEYTVGALSGCWWWSRHCADGSPNGYLVCHFDGNHLKDHIYKSIGYKDKFQMRIYRGDASYGGKFETFTLKEGHDVLLVNVFNWEQGGKIDVYENGKLCQTLTEPMPVTGGLCPEPGNSKDWWAIGYHIGVVGRGLNNNRKDYCSSCDHMFRYKMQDSSAKVKVVYTDNFGRSFSETHIFETSEYDKYADPPKYGKEDVWLYNY